MQPLQVNSGKRLFFVHLSFLYGTVAIGCQALRINSPV
jgi:hypothetical protein